MAVPVVSMTKMTDPCGSDHFILHIGFLLLVLLLGGSVVAKPHYPRQTSRRKATAIEGVSSGEMDSGKGGSEGSRIGLCARCQPLWKWSLNV